MEMFLVCECVCYPVLRLDLFAFRSRFCFDGEIVSVYCAHTEKSKLNQNKTDIVKKKMGGGFAANSVEKA